MADRKLMRTIEQIIDSKRTSEFFHSFYGGRWVKQFEKDFARYVHTKYAVSVANGTLALNAAYTALGIGHKRRAITTPYSFVATSAELIRADLTPTFVDVRPDNASLGSDRVSEELRYQAQWPASVPRVLVPMHLLGSRCDMEALMKIANDYDLVVIEDAAHALAPTYRLRGLAACFSLQSTKSLSTGEGGMVATNDKEFYEKLCYLRNQGIKYGPFKEKYADLMATNYRLTEIAACMGLSALRRYDTVVKHQLMLGKILKEAITGCNWLYPQEPWSENGYIFGSAISNFLCSPVCSLTNRYSCEHDPAKAIRQRFLRKMKRWNRSVPGMVIGGGYTELINELPAFQNKIDWSQGGCPVAEMWRDHAVWFDIRRFGVDEVKDVARQVEKFRP